MIKIPGDATIADAKLTRYLLVPREQDDKYKFLSQAGFTQENPELLKAAIRKLADSTEAIEFSYLHLKKIYFPIQNLKSKIP